MKQWLWVTLIIGVVGIFFWTSRQNDNNSIPVVQPTKKIEVSADTPLVEATNSEGNLKLVGVSRKSQEGRVSYEFKVRDTKKGTVIPLYDTVADPGSSMSIPTNSWSPDYKQVFIKTDSPGGNNYYVFRSSGETYSDGKKYLAIGDYWDTEKTMSNIQDVSGWAGDDLLMVYTTKDDGSHGLAYWFVTSSRKFMQVREL